MYALRRFVACRAKPRYRGKPPKDGLDVDPHILLFEGAPRSGADRVLALLEGGELGFDGARVAVALHRRQDLLRCADRRAMGLRRIDAETEAHLSQFHGAEHRR